MLFSYFICKQLVFASEVNKEEEKETSENGINKAAAIIDAILLVIDEVAQEKICPIAEETGDHLLDEGIGVLQNCMGKVVDENIGVCAGKRKEELASLFNSKIENLDFSKVIGNVKVNIEAKPSALIAGNEQKVSNVLESLQFNKCRTKEILGFMRKRSKKTIIDNLGDSGTKVLTEKVLEDFSKTIVKDEMQSAGHNLADALVDVLHNSIYGDLSRIIEEKVLPFLPNPVFADDESSFAKTRNFFVVACQYIWLKIVRACY